jgi:hypothetical protein
MRQLIFVHGRAQEGKDSIALKKTWIEAWERGLEKIGLTNPLQHSQIRFPFYGDTLIEMLNGKTAEEAVDIIIRGSAAPDPEEQKIMREMVAEIAAHEGVAEADILKELNPEVIEKGPLNWGWVQGILSALDRIKPLSSRMVALVTKDVAKYLADKATQTEIDSGLRKAVAPDMESVIVSHSLGTVIAYNTLLGNTGAFPDVKVPLFVTLGSPLAVNAIKSRLRPHVFPKQVGAWYNAMDEDDVVSLYPLSKKHFNTGRTIENYTKVDNHTDNQHGIDGYLDDPKVAKKIFDAFV